MNDKQIIFKCDADCIRKNTEECFELNCIKGQESVLKQLELKEQTLKKIKEITEEDFNHTCWKTYARQLKQILQLIKESEIKHES